MERLRNFQVRRNEGASDTLFLKGVFPEDCMDMVNLFEDRLTRQTPVKAAEEQFDELPSSFDGLSSWPASTNLQCAHCTLKIKGRPWFEPQSIEPQSDGAVGVILTPQEVRGQKRRVKFTAIAKHSFCGPNCVAAFIANSHHPMPKKLARLAMLRVVARVIEGISYAEFTPSPPHTALKRYGGTMSDDQYRQVLHDLRNAKQSKTTQSLDELCRQVFEG